MMKIPAHVKFQMIEELIHREGNLLNVSVLCAAADVSRSGYYHYVATRSKREQREKRDQNDFELILEAYEYRGYHKGARSIHMRLLHMDPSVRMNIKKIRRLMNKYDLKCPIRRPNPYRRKAHSIEEGAVADNLVNRDFESRGPRKVLLTDITYIINGRAPRCYMCTILDGCTKEVLAWTVSTTMEVDLVLDAVNRLIEDHGISLHADTLIHSDQGSQYKSVKFIQLIQDHELTRSMSRKANCWDNAPQESFFGHMKDEANIEECEDFDQLYITLEDWVDYYNNDRYQWNLAKLAPSQYYRYTLTGRYPLAKN